MSGSHGFFDTQAAVSGELPDGTTARPINVNVLSGGSGGGTGGTVNQGTAGSAAWPVTDAALTSGAARASVGGFTGSAVVQPTISTTAYAAGQVVGGLLSFAGLVRAGQSSGIIQNARAVFADAQAPQLDLVLFAAQPTASTITNGTALAVAAADVPKVIGVVHMTDATSLGTPTLVQALGIAMSYVLAAAGGTLYAALVTRAALTSTTTTGPAITLAGPDD